MEFWFVIVLPKHLTCDAFSYQTSALFAYFIVSSGGLLWRRWWIFGFHKKARYFWQVEWQSAFQIIFCTTE
jgi:hypothetical protein